MTANTNTRLVLAVTGLVQGFFVYLLSEGDWDADGRWLVTAMTLAVLGPLTFQLTYGIGGLIRSVLGSLAFGVLIAALWLWLDTRVQWGGEERFFDDHIFIFLISVTIAAYILIPFLQTWLETGRWRLPYTGLFQYAWNNILVLKIAVLFLGVFWLVLLLWWLLFNLVGIDFFEDLFTESRFAWMFSGTVLGLGIAIARENPRIVPTLRRVVLLLFQVLAPVLAVAAILFLIVLPFTGLEPLWNTGSATGVLVALMFAIVLVVNAVVQDGEQDETTFGPWLNRLMAMTLVLLPVFAGLAFYATWLRIDQYGLTPERFIAKLIVMLAAVQVLAYAFGVIRYRDGWARFVYRANPVIALIVAGAALLIHTPLLDPYSRSASDQMARLIDGKVDAAHFDFAALKFNLGQPGREALAEIASMDDLPQQALVDERLAEVAQEKSYWDVNHPDRPALSLDQNILIVRPEGTTLPDGLLTAVTQSYDAMGCDRERDVQCGILFIDIDRDGRDEALFLTSQSYLDPWAHSPFDLSVFYWNEDRQKWAQGNTLSPQFGTGYEPHDFWQDFIDGDYELVEPKAYDIRFGDKTFRF